MKKSYPIAKRGREWAKHLRPYGKRRANKGTRRVTKKEILTGVYRSAVSPKLR